LKARRNPTARNGTAWRRNALTTEPRTRRERSGGQAGGPLPPGDRPPPAAPLLPLGLAALAVARGARRVPGAGATMASPRPAMTANGRHPRGIRRRCTNPSPASTTQPTSTRRAANPSTGAWPRPARTAMKQAPSTGHDPHHPQAGRPGIGGHHSGVSSHGGMLWMWAGSWCARRSPGIKPSPPGSARTWSRLVPSAGSTSSEAASASAGTGASWPRTASRRACDTAVKEGGLQPGAEEVQLV
jgi:hypothetical protein